MSKMISPNNSLLQRMLMFVVMVLLTGATCAFAQKGYTRDIMGIVLDENGEPLPAAQVLQQRQSNNESLHGVVTDLNGHFTLTIPTSAQAIEISFIGYKKKIVALSNEKDYKIEMEPQSEMLDEVMVTGYQTLSKERSTGSFTAVKAKDLEQIRPSSLGNLLEGQIAGYTDGMLRGVTTMNGVTTPLYVVDGFPIESSRYSAYGSLLESVPQLNMEDIESITVLKDAAAASIYGARAANGVIVITTKKAKEGQTNIHFSSTFTVQPYEYYTDNILDAAGMIGIEREWAAANAQLQDPAKSAAYAQTLLDNANYTSAGIRTLLKAYAGQISMADANAQLDNWAKMGYKYYRDAEKASKQNPF
ncbi:MAG: TonB-dependent receptor plug domain-containing protein, partial [Bacteroidales bacterium]|nr:TonB-dependent receptor plug domain-containing protein [Bacteroidales bacterium]